MTTYFDSETELAREYDLMRFRDKLGKRVREVWVNWAKEQPNPKPHWLSPWEDLAEPDKEVDRRIGEAIWYDCFAEYQDAIAKSIIESLTEG